jgi:hypothetical protein
MCRLPERISRFFWNMKKGCVEQPFFFARSSGLLQPAGGSDIAEAGAGQV